LLAGVVTGATGVVGVVGFGVSGAPVCVDVGVEVCCAGACVVGVCVCGVCGVGFGVGAGAVLRGAVVTVRWRGVCCSRAALLTGATVPKVTTSSSR